MMNISQPLQHKQNGMATILIILVVGISLMALSMSIVHNVKSTQQKHIAANATAHVQPLAWTGVEVFRSYLENLSEDEVKALAPSANKIPISVSTIKDANAVIKADILEASTVVPDGLFEYYRIPVRITAFDHVADASSTVEVVYYIAPPGGKNCLDCTTLEATLDFRDDLELEGNLGVKAPSGKTATFNVDGSISATNISLNHINYLNSTGNITLSSGTFIDELFSNGDINLSGSASTLKASALGNVNLTSQAAADIIETNSNVLLQLSGQARTSIDALGIILNDSTATQGAATAGKDILIPATGGSMTQASAVGNVDIAGGSMTIPAIKAQGNVACPGSYWKNFDSIRAQGIAINCPIDNPNANNPIDYDIVDNTPVTIKLMTPLTPFSMPSPTVNVWPLKDYANYVFTPEGNNMRVLVRNINGLENGNYYLADYPQNGRHFKNYLCKEINNAGTCVTPATPQETRTLCYGFSVSDACLSYDSTEDRWTFNGKSFAPGIIWLDGNLTLDNGFYYNTFLATGNIDTAGGMKTSASNFASFASTCELDYPENKNTTGDFDELYPVNLCNISGSAMHYNPIGNIALASGGTPPGESTYAGGIINLGSSNEINGTLLAGENLITHGSTTVRGYITAASESGKKPGLDNNTLGGSTTIDLENLPEGYDPSTVPPMEPVDPDDDSQGKGFSKIIWARYL
ncbi:hypothetical protein [Marinagarivorans cellulosilyticus]|uniref:Uncharacterized protein n=1 Tax=Marinagarivorans cellulosilyticus TaxID=2721545 RepID=A0AAN1WFN0_9GAMM|nr:hypothetical protein [Marinagarivorans cellulosilyticus]BCD96703.1 hypothetical protein MARGE09_P0903 [Marinagarivorans cellulosilyticus]